MEIFSGCAHECMHASTERLRRHPIKGFQNLFLSLAFDRQDGGHRRDVWGCGRCCNRRLSGPDRDFRDAAARRYLGMHYFTNDAGGNQMMYVNLFWAWAHPEAYVLIHGLAASLFHNGGGRRRQRVLRDQVIDHRGADGRQSLQLVVHDVPWSDRVQDADAVCNRLHRSRSSSEA
jgi:hypothetical protein